MGARWACWRCLPRMWVLLHAQKVRREHSKYFARNEDVHERSDIDLVVVGELPGRIFERIGLVLRMTDLPVEPWIYTPAEWEELLSDRHPFAEEVLSTGVDL